MKEDSPLPIDFSLVLAASVHDMKNSVGMLMQTLEDFTQHSPPADDKQARDMAILGYEAARINGELIQLLALYRMEKHRLLVTIDEHFIGDIIDEQLARNDILFESRGLAVELSCDPDLHWYVDAELLGGVINNLLVNASRYSHSLIKIAAYIEQDALQLIIADNGEGYPESMLNAPPHSTDSVSFNSGSTHLGLLFAREVARMHRRDTDIGSVTLSNGGLLSGGEVRLRLP